MRFPVFIRDLLNNGGSPFCFKPRGLLLRNLEVGEREAGRGRGFLKAVRGYRCRQGKGDEIPSFVCADSFIVLGAEQRIEGYVHTPCESCVYVLGCVCAASW